jgi:hypothetical protein
MLGFGGVDRKEFPRYTPSKHGAGQLCVATMAEDAFSIRDKTPFSVCTRCKSKILTTCCHRGNTFATTPSSVGVQDRITVPLLYEYNRGPRDHSSYSNSFSASPAARPFFVMTIWKLRLTLQYWTSSPHRWAETDDEASFFSHRQKAVSVVDCKITPPCHFFAGNSRPRAAITLNEQKIIKHSSLAVPAVGRSPLNPRVGRKYTHIYYKLSRVSVAIKVYR